MIETPIHSAIGYLKISTDDQKTFKFRVYPFTFSNDPEKNDVCEIIFNAKNLDMQKLSECEGDEVDIDIYPNEISIFYFGETYEFEVNSLKCDMVPYEMEDYVSHIKGLDALWQSANHENHKLQRKLEAIEKLTCELIRRAEIKASSNSERKQKYEEAEKVLIRILAEIRAKA